MILADTGFWLALGNRRDSHHDAALRAARRFEREGFATTWPVLTETTHLLCSRIGPAAMQAFMAGIDRGGGTVFDPPDDAVHRASVLMQRYADLPMDLADASLVMLAEELGEGRILSTDRRDFAGYRWKNTRPFTNLLLDD